MIGLNLLLFLLAASPASHAETQRAVWAQSEALISEEGFSAEELDREVTTVELDPAFLEAKLEEKMNPHLFVQYKNTTPADQLQKVEQAHLKMIGRGVMNRKTKDSISMACVGKPINQDSLENNCDVLRNVFFVRNSTDAYFFGAPLIIASAGEIPTTKQIKTSVRKLMQSYRSYKKSVTKAAFKSMWVGGSMIWGAGIGILIYGLVAATVTMPIMLGIVAVGVLGCAFAIMAFYRSVVVSRVGKVFNATVDQQGWNWSIIPRKIQPHQFNIYFNFLDSGSQVKAMMRSRQK